MSHKPGRFHSSGVRTREQVPHMRQMKEGAQILCPFCTPTHPLAVGEPSPCGTQLKLTAVQTIISSRVARMNNITCIKCHKEGHGDMVKYMNSYVHLEDCDPKIRLLKAIPNNNIVARIVFSLPKGLRRTIEKATGRADQVRELDQAGKETGKAVAYFFEPKRRKEAVNG